jgi:hypothetical protein
MADPIFDGTTFSFGGAAYSTSLVSIEYDNSPPEVPKSGSTATYESVINGIGTETLTVELLGSPAIAAKAKGATAVTWSDTGTIGSFTNAQCTARTNGGGYNGQITTKLTFRPSNA